MDEKRDESTAFAAEFYDHVVPHRERKGVELFIDTARRSKGSVLEVGCETGRILIPIARAGVAITGVEHQPRMLAVIEQKLSREPKVVREAVTVHEGDARTFDLGKRFDFVFMPFRGFQRLLTVEDQMACLERLRAHLAPEGRLILDLFNPSLPRLVTQQAGTDYAKGEPITLHDGRTVARRQRTLSVDLHQQLVRYEIVWDVTRPNGPADRHVQQLQLRYLFRFEAEHLLARCGLATETVYSDHDRSPYGAKYPGELIFVAKPL